MIGFFNGNKEVVVKKNEILKITVPFLSSPRPKVIWLKHGEELIEDERIKLSYNLYSVELTTTMTCPKDAGTYSCTLKNDLGQEQVNIRVIVIDKPSQPQGLIDVSEIKSDGCKISWKPPKVFSQIYLSTI